MNVKCKCGSKEITYQHTANQLQAKPQHQVDKYICENCGDELLAYHKFAEKKIYDVRNCGLSEKKKQKNLASGKRASLKAWEANQAQLKKLRLKQQAI